MDRHNINGCNCRVGRYFRTVDVIIWFVQRTIHLYNTELDCSIRNVFWGGRKPENTSHSALGRRQKSVLALKKNSMIDKNIIFSCFSYKKKNTHSNWILIVFIGLISMLDSRLPRARLKCVQCTALENGLMVIEVWNRFAIVCKRVRSLTENKPPIIKPFVKCVADGWCRTSEKMPRPIITFYWHFLLLTKHIGCLHVLIAVFITFFFVKNKTTKTVLL